MAGRVTQDVIEVGILPDSAVVRITQYVEEVGVVPDSAVVRVTQDVVEVAIIDPTYTTGRPPRAWGYIMGA